MHQRLIEQARARRRRGKPQESKGDGKPRRNWQPGDYWTSDRGQTYVLNPDLRWVEVSSEDRAPGWGHGLHFDYGQSGSEGGQSKTGKRGRDEDHLRHSAVRRVEHGRIPGRYPTVREEGVQQMTAKIEELILRRILTLRAHMGYTRDKLRSLAESIIQAVRSSPHSNTPERGFYWAHAGRRAKNIILLHCAILAARQTQFRKWIRGLLAQEYDIAKSLDIELNQLFQSLSVRADEALDDNWILSKNLMAFILRDNKHAGAVGPEDFLNMFLFIANWSDFGTSRAAVTQELRSAFTSDIEPYNSGLLGECRQYLERGDMKTIHRVIGDGIFWQSVLWEPRSDYQSVVPSSNADTFLQTFGPFSCRLAAMLAMMHSETEQDIFYAAGNDAGGAMGAIFDPDTNRKTNGFRDLYNLNIVLQGDNTFLNLVDSTSEALVEFENHVEMCAEMSTEPNVTGGEPHLSTRLRAAHVVDTLTNTSLMGEGDKATPLGDLSKVLQKYRDTLAESFVKRRRTVPSEEEDKRARQIENVTESFIYAICSDYMERIEVVTAWLKGDDPASNNTQRYLAVRPDFMNAFQQLGKPTKRSTALVSMALCGSALYDIIVARSICQASLNTIVDDYYYEQIMGRFAPPSDASWLNELNMDTVAPDFATRSLAALHQAANAVQYSSLYVAIRANLHHLVYESTNRPLSRLWDMWNAYMILCAAGHLPTAASYGSGIGRQPLVMQTIAAIGRRWCKFESPYHHLSPAYSADILRRTAPSAAASRAATTMQITALIGAMAGDHIDGLEPPTRTASDTTRRYLTSAANAIFGIGASDIEQVACGAFVRAAVDMHHDAVAMDIAGSDSMEDSDMISRPNVFATFESAMRDYATYAYPYDAVIRDDNTDDGLRIGNELSYMWMDETSTDEDDEEPGEHPLGEVRTLILNTLLADAVSRNPDQKGNTQWYDILTKSLGIVTVPLGWLTTAASGVTASLMGRGRRVGERRLFVPQFRTIRPAPATSDNVSNPWLRYALTRVNTMYKGKIPLLYELHRNQYHRARRIATKLKQYSKALPSSYPITRFSDEKLPDWAMQSLYALDQQLFADALGARAFNTDIRGKNVTGIEATLTSFYESHRLSKEADANLSKHIVKLIEKTAAGSNVLSDTGQVIDAENSLAKNVSNWMKNHYHTGEKYWTMPSDGRSSTFMHLLLNLCQSPYNFTLSSTSVGVADARGTMLPPLISPMLDSKDVNIELVGSQAGTGPDGKQSQIQATRGHAEHDKVTPDESDEVDEMRAWFDDVF